MKVEATGVEEARARLAAMEARLLDLGPALRVIAAEVEQRTDDALDRSMSQSGEAWPALAPSTVIARARKQKSFSRKSKSGRLTKGAREKRATALLFNMGAGVLGGSAFAKALIDTGRLRNSQRARVVGNTIEWSAVGYLGPHITGGRSGNPPKRNPTVFERRATGWTLIASMAQYVARTVHKYVTTGAVA